jgi:hypothetical protein
MVNEYNNIGLKGITKSYFDIFKNKGLSEQGKDKFIWLLVETIFENKDLVPRKELDTTIEIIRAIRDELYESLPTGDIDAFKLLNVVKDHIKNIDDAFPMETKK